MLLSIFMIPLTLERLSQEKEREEGMMMILIWREKRGQSSFILALYIPYLYCLSPFICRSDASLLFPFSSVSSSFSRQSCFVQNFSFGLPLSFQFPPGLFSSPESFLLLLVLRFIPFFMQFTTYCVVHFHDVA